MQHNILPEETWEMKNTSKDNILFEIYQELGECYTHTQNLGKAMEHFNLAMQIDNSSERPYIGIGVALLQQNKSAEAKKHFEEALARNPNSDTAVAGLAMALSGNGQTIEGFQKYQEALDINPENMSALMGVITGAYSFERFDVAVSYLQNYLALYPGNIKILYCLAGTYVKLNRLDDASEVLKKIFIFEPNHAASHELLKKVDMLQHEDPYRKCQNS